MHAHPTDYIIENTPVSDLSFLVLSRHCSEAIDTSERDFFGIQAETIEIDFGLFSNPASKLDFPVVSVSQVNHSVIVSCSCPAPKNRLCRHQSQVLFNIVDRQDFRIFYDPSLRQSKIQQLAKGYGMENEPGLDEFFQLEYANKTVTIKPKLKELIRVNESTTSLLKEQLLPKAADRFFYDQKIKKMILVIRKHRYYEQFQIELFEGEATKDGKIKNPLTPADPLSLFWKTTKIEEAKFFTAISRFQNNYTAAETVPDIEALNTIVGNPLNLDVFYHNREASENVTAGSIVAVKLKKSDAEIKLSVFKKEPFYEVSGELCINDKACALRSLNIKYTYFIFIDHTLHLIADPDTFRIIAFFKANNQKIIIHSSKYDEFRQNILAPLEDQIGISYAYIKPASAGQIAEQSFDQLPQRIIYLSDQENFVSITPVVKYGHVEIPVFSRKQIYDSDLNGNVFKVERDHELEDQFTSIIVRQHPDFEEQLGEARYFYLHKKAFLDENWFLDAFEEWKNQQIQVLGFNEIRKNKLNQNKAKVVVSVCSGIDWFSASLVVSYGNQKASLKQLHRAIRNNSKFVHLDDGTLGILPDEWMKKIAGYFGAGETAEEQIRIPKSNFRDINRLFDDVMLDETVRRDLTEYGARFSNFDRIGEVEVPVELNASLRDYQKEGLKWLNFMDDFNFGACLADDMGLGKTIQIIAFILLQRSKQAHNTNLIVVPASLLFNWQAEVEKFAPSIRMLTQYGSTRAGNSREFDRYEIVLTTYGMLLSDIGVLKNYHFNYIFLDESQAIKNPGSQRYKAARILKSRNRVVLTGTPVENNTFDIYGQLSFACPGLLGNLQYFRDIYSTPIDKFGNSERAAELQKKIEPFILRRTKKQVAKELPEKTEMVIYCEMGEEQRKVYDEYETELREYISSKNDDEISRDSMHILTGLMRLRQICNSPVLLKDDEHLSDFSSKIETLIEQIENKSSQHKILVFSQFVSMLDLIKSELENRAVVFEYLTGKTRNRASTVNGFRENEDVRVFLISLKAGGTGLNLSEADYVYLVDPWWNPAVENQAIDRCYRIGQKKHVIAVRLICPNTIEEKIMKLQQSKRELVSDLIKSDTSFIKSFSKKDLMAMLQ